MGNMFAHSYSRALAPALVGLALVACDNTGRGPGTNSTGTRRDAGVRFDGGGYNFDAGEIVSTSRRDTGVLPGVDGGPLSPFNVDIVRNETNMTDDAAAALFDGEPNPALAPLGVLYPLSDAMMPANARPPLVQWQEDARGDIVRVRFTRGRTVRVTAYVQQGGNFAYPLRAEDMASLQANGTEDIEIELTYHDTNGYAPGAYRYFKIASGRLYGSVYFWNLNSADTERINVATGQLDTPVPALTAPLGCMACHTVARDGTKLVASNLSYSYSYNVTGPATGIFGVAPGSQTPLAFDFPAYDPTGDYVIGSSSDGASLGTFGIPLPTNPEGAPRNPLRLVDARTGTVIQMRVPADEDHAIFTAWSADGTRVAYTSNHDHPWATNPTTGDLRIMDVTPGAPPTFGASRDWVSGASLSGQPEGGSAIAHLTWSPDSNHLIFQHGPVSFASTPALINLLPPIRGAGERHPTALYIVGRDTNNPRRLSNASGPNAWWPTFSPFLTPEQVNGETHRFAWVLFYSRRNYGNSVAGTGSPDGNESTGANFRQLWISAVDLDSTDPDPSYAPYWIDGQTIQAHNAAAYWAPEPCVGNGDSCSAGGAGVCCTGYCDPDTILCAAPPEGCRELGQRCSEDSDCCGWDNPLEPIKCGANVCDIFVD